MLQQTNHQVITNQSTILQTLLQNVNYLSKIVLFFSMIVVIAELIFIFVIFLYTKLFGKRWVVANL